MYWDNFTGCKKRRSINKKNKSNIRASDNYTRKSIGRQKLHHRSHKIYHKSPKVGLGHWTSLSSIHLIKHGYWHVPIITNRESVKQNMGGENHSPYNGEKNRSSITSTNRPMDPSIYTSFLKRRKDLQLLIETHKQSFSLLRVNLSYMLFKYHKHLKQSYKHMATSL